MTGLRIITAVLLALLGITLIAGGIASWGVHGHATVLGLALFCFAAGVAFA